VGSKRVSIERHRRLKRQIDSLFFRSFAMEFVGADDMDGKPEG
jgi:hypothetical protein